MMFLWINIFILINSSASCKEITIHPQELNETIIRSTAELSAPKLKLTSTSLNETTFSQLKGRNLTLLPDFKSHSKKRENSMNFSNFIGSNLFNGDRKNCFSSEDINILAARLELERTIPQNMHPTILDDKSISAIMRYFSYGHLSIRRMKKNYTSKVLKKAFFDAFGGFLHHFLVPVGRISFYYGDVKLKTIRKVLDYYWNSLFFLNTNGNGWRSPLLFSIDDLKRLSSISILNDGNAPPYNTKSSYGEDYCSGLNLLGSQEYDIVDQNIIVAMPKIELEDNNGFLSNIWLPYQRKTTYSLRSYNSAFLLVKFFKKISQCYEQKRIPRNAFDEKFKQWLSENLLGHVFDEEFYPSFGGIISLYKNLNGWKAAHKQRANENIVDKRDDKIFNSLKQKRKSTKYLELEGKSKTVTACEMDWLPFITNDDKFQKKKLQNHENLKKSKNKFKNTKTEKALLKEKNINVKNNDESWLQWFELNERTSFTGALKNTVKCLMIVLFIYIVILLLWKMISWCKGAFQGVAGSTGDHFFCIIWKLILDFFRASMTALVTVFTCLVRYCTNKKQTKSTYPPEIKETKCRCNIFDKIKEKKITKLKKKIQKRDVCRRSSSSSVSPRKNRKKKLTKSRTINQQKKDCTRTSFSTCCKIASPKKNNQIKIMGCKPMGQKTEDYRKIPSLLYCDPCSPSPRNKKMLECKTKDQGKKVSKNNPLMACLKKNREKNTAMSTKSQQPKGSKKGLVSTSSESEFTITIKKLPRVRQTLRKRDSSAEPVSCRCKKGLVEERNGEDAIHGSQSRQRRKSAGQSYKPIYLSPDSSCTFLNRELEERTSWQTFYDF